MKGKLLIPLKVAIETARLNAEARGKFATETVAEYFIGLNPNLWAQIETSFAFLHLVEFIGKQPKPKLNPAEYSLEAWLPGYSGPLFVSIHGQICPVLQLPPHQAVKIGQNKLAQAIGTSKRARQDRKAATDLIRAGREALPYVAGDPKATTGEGLEARRRYLKTAAAKQRREAAEKAREAKRVKHART